MSLSKKEDSKQIMRHVSSWLNKTRQTCIESWSYITSKVFLQKWSGVVCWELEIEGEFRVTVLVAAAGKSCVIGLSIGWL